MSAKPKSSRVAFGEALAELGATHPHVVALDGDLSKSTMTMHFAKKYPERFFNMGIAEGNMVGVASGLALSGKVPFAATFACFLIGRYEQIRMSVAYQRANVKLVGTHTGVGIGEDGYSQMGTEDIALVRALPNITILSPADEVETKQAVRWAAEHDGPVYLRLTRQNLEPVVGDDYRFEVGKGVVLREGTDVAVFATGGVVFNSLEAARALAGEGIDAAVVNIHTIAPIDRELILDVARRTRRVVTVEDHSVTGGLGAAVSDVLSESAIAPVHRVGVHGFGESGSPSGLYEKFGLSAPKIADSIRSFVRGQKG